MSTCHDTAEIQRALEAIIEPGQVVELRALGVSTSRYPRPHTESGYFDDMAPLAKAAASLTRAKGIYFTPNPLTPPSCRVPPIDSVSRTAMTP